MLLPESRGALSAEVFERLRSGESSGVSPDRCESVDDLHITLWTLYELHYRGFEEVDEAREWDPQLLGLRRALEDRLEAELREAFDPVPADDPVATLARVIAESERPSVARFVQRHASREEVLEILRHRSIYHLKEADPSTWVVPRVEGRVKTALVELQFDEYGAGDPARLHADLFARALRAAGLCSDYGRYIDVAPPEILRMNNIVTFFGLHRRLRGAALGHLAAFEATSSIPSARMVRGLRRLGFPEATIAYYDEHVEADAVHEQLALREICGVLVADKPELGEQVLFGAASYLDAEERYARLVLDRFDAEDAA